MTEEGILEVMKHIPNTSPIIKEESKMEMEVK